MPSSSSSKLADDRVVKAAPGEPADRWVYSAFQKDHWVARTRGDMMRAEHPGTAIQTDDGLYEVVKAEETIEPGYAVRYGLKRWESHHAVRHAIPYTPETHARAAEAHLGEARRQQLRKRITWLFFLAGLAPDSLQRKWEAETALNMTLISAASSITNVAVFMTLAQISGGIPASGKLAYLIEYIGLDGFVRLLWTVVSGQPHGMLILSLPYLLWEAVARPEKRAEKKEWVKFSLEGDEVIRRPGANYLVVRSMLYDDLLAGPAPILFEGQVYKPLHWHEEGKGLRRRWVYEFDEIDANPQVKYREYTRPRSPQRQKIVEDFTQKRDRVHVLAMIWGTYPREAQLRLEAKYHFPSVQWTSVTASIFLATALLQAWATFLFGGSIVLFTGPIYLFFESLYRLYRSKGQAQPAASFVGVILNFFLKPPP